VEILTHALRTSRDARVLYISRLVSRGGGFRPQTLASWPPDRLAREVVRLGAEHPQDELELLGFPTDPDSASAPLFRPVGCTSCSGTGYRGRIAVHEVMAVSKEIERLAVSRASSAEIGLKAREQGMLTLRQDGWAKVRSGLTSIEEVLRVVA